MTTRAYRVLFTRTAIAHVEAIAEWWEKERALAPGLFATELATCVELLARAPRLGVPYPHDVVPELRRVLVRRCGYHVYFRVDDAAGTVVIHAVWHSARGAGPELP